MLGKRFRRTTSMSQLGPDGATSEEIQGMQSPNTKHVPSGPHHKAARPLLTLEGERQYRVVQARSDDVDVRNDGDANMRDVPVQVFDVSEEESRDQVVEGPLIINVLFGGGGDTSMGVAAAVRGFDPLQAMISDRSFPDSPPLQVAPPPAALVPFQMGLWTHHNIGIGPQVGHYSTSFGKLEHAAEYSISPVDFLDVCFFCRRRLRHERDIFIYRGDTAFCSEECRHRQILSDERRSMRGGRATSTASETAVAA